MEFEYLKGNSMIALKTFETELEILNLFLLKFSMNFIQMDKSCTMKVLKVDRPTQFGF